MSKTHVHGEEVPEAEKIQPCSTVVFLLSRCRFKNSLLNLPPTYIYVFVQTIQLGM